MRSLWARVCGVVVCGAALLPCVGVSPPPAAQPDTPNQPLKRFVNVDVFVDSGMAALAAYQVEFKGQVGEGLTGAVMLVGIEGSGGVAAAPFSEPPGYDPAALSPDGPGGGGRVIIADFSTLGADKLPHGKVRVARLHLMLEIPPGMADAKPTYSVNLIAAGSPGGEHIQATASVVEGEGR